MPTGSPTRSTKSVMTTPRSSEADRGFSLGRPTSSGRFGKRVTTADRVTAARPTATAVRLVAPTDSPTPSVIPIPSGGHLIVCLGRGRRRYSANRAVPGNQGQVKGGHPARRPIVDGGYCVERAHAGSQATCGRGVAAGAIRETKSRLLEDAWSAL